MANTCAGICAFRLAVIVCSRAAPARQLVGDWEADHDLLLEDRYMSGSSRGCWDEDRIWEFARQDALRPAESSTARRRRREIEGWHQGA